MISWQEFAVVFFLSTRASCFYPHWNVEGDEQNCRRTEKKLGWKRCSWGTLVEYCVYQRSKHTVTRSHSDTLARLIMAIKYVSFGWVKGKATSKTTWQFYEISIDKYFRRNFFICSTHPVCILKPSVDYLRDKLSDLRLSHLRQHTNHWLERHITQMKEKPLRQKLYLHAEHDYHIGANLFTILTIHFPSSSPIYRRIFWK